MADLPWWQTAVFYQVYPRSFADSDGDGIGDLEGIRSHLDHLERLGVDALWLNPTMPSPDDDMGYDVADYRGVHPALGDLAALDRLIAAAGERGIRVLLDLVPNHTSDRHPWFQESRGGPDAAKRNYYVWRDGRGEAPPNNWLAVFGGPAWTRDERTGQWWLHQFLSSQPDLNWWNEEVRREFDAILGYWFERGVAGFRIDTANRIVKHPELPDNPPSGPDDHPLLRRLGQRHQHNTDQPEVHAVLRRWRALADRHPGPPVLVGETWFYDLDNLARYHGQGDELHLAFNFPFVHARFNAAALRQVVEATDARLGALGAWPAWTGSNHDVPRFPSRWCGGDAALTRCGLMMLLTLRGTPFLYYGDEIGMTNVPVPAERARDPLFHRFPDQRRGRDGERTPMQWARRPGGGFTAPEVEPWLPLGELDVNVADQESDPGSVLNLTRDLIHLRRERPDLLAGHYHSVESPGGAWCYRRSRTAGVILNLGEEAEPAPFLGRVLIGTDRDWDGRPIRPGHPVPPRTGLLIDLS